MKNHAILAGTIALTALLVACGGGGGGGVGGPPPTNPPTTQPQKVTFSGIVTQLSGSLAHMTGSCQTGTGQCPTPPANIPSTPSPTPVPGTPIAGANVYITTATGVFTNGTPNPVLATATTAPDGSFTTPALQVSAFGGKAGIVVLNGSTVSATNGLTDKGFAVLHTQVAVSSGNVVVPNLEIDSLSSDEAAGAPAVENARSKNNMPPLAVDEYALETARWSAQNGDGEGTSNCQIQAADYAVYTGLGGVGTAHVWGDIANPTLSGAIDVMYQPPSGSEVWGAATGPTGEAQCGNAVPGWYAYYQMVTVSP